jgi:hypothetical protein
MYRRIERLQFRLTKSMMLDSTFFLVLIITLIELSICLPKVSSGLPDILGSTAGLSYIFYRVMST